MFWPKFKSNINFSSALKVFEILKFTTLRDIHFLKTPYMEENLLLDNLTTKNC